ncbi:uncharacterized protein B0J16DRAFT_371913 [Fusarium flagelliforme]|uniref:uncharacterized protein n=1 Tax=Fusarium flagelliforme TaxID=2675880 RepID=UPI001E8DF33C|nr:uncharacterized protein B0J16DRAFT_371913 [Fusarium flagelliforme]KAH7185049.1 hypothetical protein B0J16DRAFT_371913 [Fusarium flagelliforme]
MEPVSLLIGIVPLCAQLAKTTTTINNLISTYKSAARELEALSNTLADVANVCESLGDILYTTDTSQHHPSEARLFAALHGKIQECHDRLTDIQDIIQIVNGKRRGPFRNEGFLFLQFKDKISSCTKSIRLLQSPRMETNILEDTNSPSRSNAVVAPDQASISGHIDTSPISTDVSRKSIRETTCAMKSWQRSFLGLAFIARTTMQKKTVHIDGSGPSITEDYSTFTAGSPFSSWSIKVSSMDLVCHSLTLDQLAAALTAPRILEFARSQMTMVEERKQFPDGPRVFKFMLETSDLQCAVDYINMRKNGMCPDELNSILAGVLTCSQLKACIDAYLTWSSPARGCFHRVLGTSVLKAFSNQHLLEHDVEDWASFISEHISRGLDIYSDLESHLGDDASTLTAILRHPACSDVAVSNLHLWLDVLELAGVEIGQYLKIETPRCVATWGRSAKFHMRMYRDEVSLINRVLNLHYSRGRLIPYWRQEIDSTCPIRELLIEFPRFLHTETTDTRAAPEDTVRLRRAWKAGENARLVYPENVSWPVAPEMADERKSNYPNLPQVMSVECVKAIKWLDREYYRRKGRWERKLERKMLKGARNRKSHGEVMLPGSWVD